MLLRSPAESQATLSAHRHARGGGWWPQDLEPSIRRRRPRLWHRLQHLIRAEFQRSARYSSESFGDSLPGHWPRHNAAAWPRAHAPNARESTPDSAATSAAEWRGRRKRLRLQPVRTVRRRNSWSQVLPDALRIWASSRTHANALSRTVHRQEHTSRLGTRRQITFGERILRLVQSRLQRAPEAGA